MQYYKLKKDNSTGQEIWSIKEGLVGDGSVPSTTHKEILPVLVEIQRNHVMLTIPAVVEKNTAFVSEDALQAAIEKHFKVTNKNRAMKGVDYVERPVPATIKALTTNEIKAWVKELGLGKATQVTIKTREKWLKKIVNKLEEIEGNITLTKQATITIEETTGWRAGKTFLPIEKSTKKRVINVDDKRRKTIKIGADSFKKTELLNLSMKMRHFVENPEMIRKIEAYEKQRLREGKPLHSGRGLKRMTGRRANRAEQETGAIGYKDKYTGEILTLEEIERVDKLLDKLFRQHEHAMHGFHVALPPTYRKGREYEHQQAGMIGRSANIGQNTFDKTISKMKSSILGIFASHVNQRVTRHRAEQETGAIAYPVPKSTTNIEGALGIVGGMSNPNFVGGFIKAEEKFIEEMIFLKNQQLGGSGLDFKESSMKLANGNDLHLFCGQDQHATTRIDIRKMYPYKMKINQKEIKPSVGDKPGVMAKRTKEDKEADEKAWEREQDSLRALGKRVPDKPPARYSMQLTSATKHVLVQDFMADAIAKGEKYDLIIIDPPYNATYDAKYGTEQFNNIGENNRFLASLVDACTQILNPDGILISKNWRNIRPLDSDFVAGIITLSGGFRRAVIMEAWQFQPGSPIEFDWEYYQSESVYNKKVRPVSWILGIPGKWTKNETRLMKNYVNIDSTKNGVVITDPMGPSKSATVKIGNCINMSIEEFLVDHKKRDVIILDECKSLGGAVPKTALLKDHLADIFDLDHSKDMKIKGMTGLEEMEEGEEEIEEGEGENEAKIAWQSEIYNHAVEVLSKNGLVFTKTYFNPVLDKKGLQLLENHVICYEKFETISLFYVYGKP